MNTDKHIVILVGVCGTGKSTIGEKLAGELEVPFFDADMLPATKELNNGKLSQNAGHEKWLTALKILIIGQSTKKGCVISCSVLKREQRLKLAAQINFELDWVFMKGSYEFVVERSEKIGDHNRSAAVLKSDFEMLDVPKRALTIDMTYSEQDMVDTILKYLARKYG